MTLSVWRYKNSKKLHYFEPIENCYIKIHHVCFNNFNMLYKTGRKNRFFTTSTILNLIVLDDCKETRENTCLFKLYLLLYLLYLSPCLDLSLFMSYLCDRFFIFILSFIMISRVISWIETHMFFCLFFSEYVPFLDYDVMTNVNNFQIAKVQLHGVA